jgi:hypothetical protein
MGTGYIGICLQRQTNVLPAGRRPRLEASRHSQIVNIARRGVNGLAALIRDQNGSNEGKRRRVFRSNALKSKTGGFSPRIRIEGGKGPGLPLPSTSTLKATCEYFRQKKHNRRRTESHIPTYYIRGPVLREIHYLVQVQSIYIYNAEILATVIAAGVYARDNNTRHTPIRGYFVPAP